MPVEKDFTRANIDFLKFRRNTHPHLYVTTVRGGCKICGQGPGALQHNMYLVADYEELKREDEDSERRIE